jgi:hypothetical protein
MKQGSNEVRKEKKGFATEAQRAQRTERKEKAEEFQFGVTLGFPQPDVALRCFATLVTIERR